MKGTESIEVDIYAAIAAYLKTQIGGAVYYEGMRPTDSDKEDACIAVSAVTAGQIQQGYAKINIYVRDIQVKKNSRAVKNKSRLIELEAIAPTIVSHLNAADTAYAYSLNNAPATIQDSATHEHFLNINLSFKLINFNT